MSFARILFRRTLILGAGSASGRLLPLLALLALGRTQTPDGYASISAAFAWTAVAASLTTAGLSQVLAQRLADTEQPSLQHRLVARSAIAAIILVAALASLVLKIGPYRASAFFGNVIDTEVFVPAVIAGAFWPLTMICVSICNGLHITRAAATIVATGGLLQGLGLSFGTLIDGTPRSAIWGLAFGTCAALAFASLLVIRHLPSKQAKRSSGSNPPLPSLFLPALWSTLAAACVVPVTFFASSLVVYGPRGAEELAMFHALEQVHIIAVYGSGIISQALLPLLTKHLKGQDNKHLLQRAFFTVALIGIAGIIVAALLGLQPKWLEMALGHHILFDPWAVRFMLLNASLAMTLALIGSMLIALGKFKAASLLNVLWAATLVGFALMWREHGSAGIQAARWSASVLLALITGSLLYQTIITRSQAR